MNLLDIGLCALLAWVLWYALRAAEEFKRFKHGRMLHTRRGVDLVRNETMRHGRAVAAAQEWRLQAREAEQVNVRG